MENKVSIIIPFYNCRKYIKDNVESIIGQKYRNIEIIYVNDSSTDASEEIILEYQKKDDRIKLLQQKHKGAGAARNLGLQSAKGKYVLFLDADDFIFENTIYDLMEEEQRNESDIRIFEYKYYDDVTKKTWNAEDGINHFLIPEDVTCFSPLQEKNNIFLLTSTFAWNKLYKRKFIDDNKLRFQEIERINDLFFVMMSLVTAERISITKKRLLCYRVNNSNSLINTVTKCPDTIYDAYIKTRDVMREKNIYNVFRNSFKKRMFWDFTTTLDRINDDNVYREFYNRIKNRYIYDCEIEGQSIYDFMDMRLYEMYINLRTREPDDFRRMFGLNYPYCPRVIIYGAGQEGRLAWDVLHKLRSVKIVGWVDKNSDKLVLDGICVDSIEKMSEIEYDYIYIAIRRRNTREAVIAELIESGIERTRIL